MKLKYCYLIPGMIGFLSLQGHSSLVFGNYAFLVLIQVVIILYLFKVKNEISREYIESNIKYINAYFVYTLTCSFFGIFIAESYWQWKGLMTVSLTFFMPLIVYLSFNPLRLKNFLKGYVFFALPLFPLVYLFSSNDAYGYYLSIIPLLFIGLPFLTIKSKIIVVTLTILVLTADLGARSNIVKFSVPIILVVFYYFNNYLSLKIMRFSRLILLTAPVLFLGLGLSGVFNVFNMDDYIEQQTTKLSVVDGEVIEENLKADTRTFLYVEVLKTADKYNSWIFGRTPAQGNETELFSDIENITGKSVRLANEVSILNIFSWTGLVGIFLYSLIFIKASWLGVNLSNNKFCRLVGLFVAFRWAYAWVEDFNTFSLNYFLVWIMIGICFSKSMRQMSDTEIKVWMRSIFSYKYTY